MIHIDCPFCHGPLTVDESTDQVDCETCVVSLELASDPQSTELAIAA